MITVAAFGVIFGAERAARRWSYLRAKEAYYAEAERRFRHGWVDPKGLAYVAPNAEEADRLAEKKRQFARAAWRPWEAIPVELMEAPAGPVYGAPK